MTGIICLDKSAGMTSFAAVSAAKRITGEKKAGHAGTLDPFATGVLPVAFGGCTRFLEMFPSHDKAYKATVKLGTETDTLDITGNVLSVKDFSYVKKTDFENTAKLFTGEIVQIPPMYSSVKKDGVRLYTLARQGIEIEREGRTVNVKRLELVSINEENGEYEIYVECSAGTYIRSLANDIGEKLGCGAVITALRRVSALSFTEKESCTLEQLREICGRGELEKVLMPIDRALGYKRLTVSEKQAVRFHNGGALDLDRIKQECSGRYCVYAPDGTFLGVGETDGESLSPRKIYVPT
ncbi:MAG: tRNA pseudouridine(55) synthase TruB [Clostridia bacterium]|nr:tRNA pseudouridine(55) synthase TruB [Clostridia bacterium]